MPVLLGHNRGHSRRWTLGLLAVGLAAVLGLLIFRYADAGGDHVRGMAARPDPDAAGARATPRRNPRADAEGTRRDPFDGDLRPARKAS
jgi:hypothetical protein